MCGILILVDIRPISFHTVVAETPEVGEGGHVPPTPSFGISLNPIQTKGGIFSDDAASLGSIWSR